MPESPAISAAGSVNAIWGTSKARSQFAIVISSHNQTQSAEDSTLQDENGNTIYKAWRNKSWQVSIDGVMLLDAPGENTYAAARAAITIGAPIVLPTNRALRSISGLPIVDSVTENTSNSDFATLSFTATAYEGITEMITRDTTASGADEASA